jgi:hypothetical protein
MYAAREEDAQYGIVPGQQYPIDYVDEQPIVHLYGPWEKLVNPDPSAPSCDGGVSG